MFISCPNLRLVHGDLLHLGMTVYKKDSWFITSAPYTDLTVLISLFCQTEQKVNWQERKQKCDYQNKCESM